ncbi:hypothetical protein DFH09DRAFT_1103256 [Mycena vulgaris]|nr:hypothetical protein DFH09DRAFT_1103256 [Mycena vulgaris]
MECARGIVLLPQETKQATIHSCLKLSSLSSAFVNTPRLFYGGDLALNLSMGKRKRNLQTLGEDSAEEYIGKEQESQQAKDKRVASHRSASAAYDARNLEATRERRRLRMAVTRAAAKLKRRQWDPPKMAKTHTASPVAPDESEASADVPVEEGALWELLAKNVGILEAQLEPRIQMLEALHNTGAKLNVASDMDVALTASLNSDEQLALLTLAGMAGGVVGPREAGVEIDSVLEMALLLSSHGTQAGEGPWLELAASPLMVGCLDGASIEASAMGQSTRVHQAQMAVAVLGSRPVLPLEVAEVMRWEEVSPRERPPRLPMTFAAYWRVTRWSKKTSKRADNRWDDATADAMADLAESIPVDRMLERVWDRIIG